MARMMKNKNGGGAEEREAEAGEEGTGGEEKGRGGGGEGGMKKGPWTAAEDEMLVEYVRKKGEGNWNAVQKNTGLSRCGKSCRLRWANHLRPNLKKCSVSPDEERIIIDLHSKLGNKWARMASQVPLSPLPSFSLLFPGTSCEVYAICYHYHYFIIIIIFYVS